MKRRQQIYVIPQRGRTPGDRPFAKLAAWTAAGAVLWEFHRFGIPALAGAAGAYLLVLVVLHALIGGPRG
ncbi:hypothetical protein [Streptacidiphilus fuscans]|uniref:Uncharacterized protein n=1 Tax=Streptacidiphilus fuscans TaxID=2789292 RepID=A0A931B5C9_9ACTN|nr:hypothetical protein [Streptacidiphilus fuscans]MBF9068183.1 hypothetical protein [Streptacidiphilus fuscans]